MRLADLRRHYHGRGLLEWVALGRTLEARRRIDRATHDLESWRASCERPAVSVSGGKDSTLLLLLARRVDPDIVAMRADPQNGYSDRAAHVAQLAQAAGGPWDVVPYPWDVGAVLDGREPYPHGLKIRRLHEHRSDRGFDGLAMGVRAAESKPRLLHFRLRGTSYQWADGTRVCCPLAWWTAEQVVGAILALDALPLSPVYYRTEGMPARGLEGLRDGTWWPHGRSPLGDEYSSWLRRHYPEHVEDFERAQRLDPQREEWVVTGPSPSP